MSNDIESLRRQVAALQERVMRAETTGGNWMRQAARYKAERDAARAWARRWKQLAREHKHPEHRASRHLRQRDEARAERDAAVASVAALFHAYIAITPGETVPGLAPQVQAEAEALLGRLMDLEAERDALRSMAEGADQRADREAEMKRRYEAEWEKALRERDAARAWARRWKRAAKDRRTFHEAAGQAITRVVAERDALRARVAELEAQLATMPLYPPPVQTYTSSGTVAPGDYRQARGALPYMGEPGEVLIRRLRDGDSFVPDALRAVAAAAAASTAAYDRLCRCVDEFEPDDMQACGEWRDALDTALEQQAAAVARARAAGVLE